MVGINAQTIHPHIWYPVRSSAGVSAGTSDIYAVFSIRAGIPVIFIIHGDQIAVFIAAHLIVSTRPWRQKAAWNSSSRVKTSLTGRPFVLLDTTTASDSIETPALAPNPPPTYGAITSTEPCETLQCLCDQVTLGKWGLRAGPEGDVPIFVPFGYRYMRFNRDVLDMWNLIFSFNYRREFLKPSSTSPLRTLKRFAMFVPASGKMKFG